MKFKAIEEYDNYLNEIKQDLKEIDEYLKEHPNHNTKGNYETIKHIFDTITTTDTSLYKN